MKTEKLPRKFRSGRALAVFAVAVAVLGALSVPIRASDEGPDLVGMMTKFQRFMHKAGVALHAGNFRLADFYLHEVEEVLEEVEAVESYDDHPIGEMAEGVFAPVFHELEDAVDSGNQQAALAAYENALGGCNECHQGTQHEFIVIEYRGESLPLQNFATR